MSRFTFFVALAEVPGAAFAYLIHLIRKARRERDEAKQAKQAMQKMSAETSTTPTTVTSPSEKTLPEGPIADALYRGAAQALENQKQVWTKQIRSIVPYNISVGELEQKQNVPVSGKTTGSLSTSSMNVHWKNLGEALQAREPKEVYILSVDDFDRFRADLKLHREMRIHRTIEAKEVDGLVTVRLAGITYHIASDIFRMVKEFWDYQGPGGREVGIDDYRNRSAT